MYAKANGTAYQQARVLGSSKEQLVPMMYEGLLKHLRRAGKQIRERDLEGKAQSFDKAQGIAYELLGAIDVERGGDLAGRLVVLYAYFINEIGEVSRSLDVARLERLLETIGTLHEAWLEASRAVGTRPGAAPTIATAV